MRMNMRATPGISIVAMTAVLFAAADLSAQVVNIADPPPTGAAVQFSGPSANARAGISLLRADISGDVQRADLVVGAPGAGAGGEGQAYVLFMGPSYTSGSLAAQATVILNGETGGDQFGAAVTAGMVIR